LFFCFSAELGLVLFCLGSIGAKKKNTTTVVTFFDGFATKNWRHAPFCGLAMKKGTTAMSSPSSMVAQM
jgi:hypothetical protein